MVLFFSRDVLKIYDAIGRDVQDPAKAVIVSAAHSTNEETGVPGAVRGMDARGFAVFAPAQPDSPWCASGDAPFYVAGINMALQYSAISNPPNVNF